MTDAEIMARTYWAIIKNVTTYHDGDERSRTNPGHGYPAHTTTAMVYKPYETEVEVLDALERKSKHENWMVIQAAPMVIKTTTQLELADAT